jgi:hypothetical protein
VTPHEARSFDPLVLRLVADNVALRRIDDDTWSVTDDGPGLDPAEVPSLFAVNRPLLSSKRRRLPLRGMLGNGLRVVMVGVAASGGRLSVETRGYHLDLAVRHVHRPHSGRRQRHHPAREEPSRADRATDVRTGAATVFR